MSTSPSSRPEPGQPAQPDQPDQPDREDGPDQGDRRSRRGPAEVLEQWRMLRHISDLADRTYWSMRAHEQAAGDRFGESDEYDANVRLPARRDESDVARELFDLLDDAAPLPRCWAPAASAGAGNHAAREASSPRAVDHSVPNGPLRTASATAPRFVVAAGSGGDLVVALDPGLWVDDGHVQPALTFHPARARRGPAPVYRWGQHAVVADLDASAPDHVTVHVARMFGHRAVDPPDAAPDHAPDAAPDADVASRTRAAGYDPRYWATTFYPAMPNALAALAAEVLLPGRAEVPPESP